PFAFGNKEPPGGQEGLQPVWSTDAQSVQGLSDLYSPDKAGESHVYDIADALLDMGRITTEQHAQLRSREKANQACDVADLLASSGWVGADDILEAKAKLYDLEFTHIGPDDVDRQAFEKLDVDFMRNCSLCPIAVEDGVLVVATSEPANIFAIEDVKRQTQMDVRAVVCSAEDIETVCDSFKEQGVDYNLDDIISDMTDVEVVQDEQEESEDLERMAGQSPVIKFVNYVISKAIREGASDIHIEPRDKSMRTRYRIDGVLFEMMQSPLKMHPAIVSRIKIMANLDISERRLPQDGKISVIVGGRAVDLRISTLPTSHGEKVVIRVLDSKSILRGLEQLGMEPEVMDAFRQQIALPHGILLVTGPTGSGKSTTLYSALCQMDGDSLNISTVEDPVEYELDFCNQVQSNEKIGLDFAVALRSLLRQDPDIIMIGEIRDNETARIAVQAALTGHLVLSTLHTNDAAGSITRLVNIGIDAYLIAASLNGVLAQRLVRKICPKCKELYKVPEHMRKYVKKTGVDPKQLFHGKGCDNCRGSGYLGRVGIYEFLVIDDLFRDMINKDPSVGSMRKVFHDSGRNSLFDDGIIKVKQGLTTIEEVLRVTEIYGQNENEAFVENVE
ncbi:MAG: Flp pilus assembly complex ATPase component TadA, partial [Planctomycetes bacterium]|nr:Flp pilus assembly complex ATPase component TadA [Planctomycetota bacterium]